MAKKTESEMSMPQSLRVLMVEDSEDDALLIIRELKKGGYNPVQERVETAAAMKKALEEREWDIILCDYKLPKFNAPSAIALLKETNIDIPFIIVSGTIGEETAIECMRLGADDYMMKNNLSRLCPAIARELQEAETRRKHKQVEEALRQSEEKYGTILESIDNGYCEQDLAGNFTFLNDSMYRIYGYPKEELMGMNYKQYTDKENGRKCFQAYRNIYRTGEPGKVFDFEIIRKDGTKRHIESSVSLQKDSAGKPIAFRGIVRDVTDRKLAEEALRQSEEKYRNILENIQEGYFELDLDGNYTFVNEANCRYLGYTKEELVGMNFRQHMDEENAKKLYQPYRELYLTGKPIETLEVESIRKNRTKVIYETSVSLIRDSEGKPIGFRAISRDITERKRTEEKLQESEKYFKEITENSSDIIIITDKNGDIKYCSRSIERFTGYKPEELIGRSALTLIHPDDKKRADGDFGKAILAIDYAIPNAFRIMHKDGSERYFEGLGKNLLDNPAVAGFIMNVRDITERKQAEEELRKSEEKYRNILENMEEGYFELDLAGNFTFVNDAECRNMGYPKEELIGMNNRHYQDEATAQKTYQLFIKLYRTGEPVKASDVEVIRKNGTKGFNEISASLIRDAEGKPIGFRGISRDITERKQAEAALQETEERYKALFDRSLDLVYIMDFDGRFMDANNAALNRLGYTREELPSLNFTSLLSEDQLLFAFKELQEIRETGIQKNLAEFRLRHKDGSEVYVETQGSVIISNGTPVAIQAIARDITERKRAEVALRESEAQYRLLADNMKDHLWLMDLNLKPTYISPSAEKSRGYTFEEIAQLPLDKQLTATSLKSAMEFFSIEMPKALADPTYLMTRLLELEFYRKDGSTVWLENTFSLIRDENGKPFSLLGAGRDITERKQTEEALRKSEESFRLSLDDSPLGVRIVTAEGDTLYANQATLDIYGYDSIEELRGTPPKNRYTPESYAEFQIRKGKRGRGEFSPSEYEISIVRKNGQVRHVQVFRKAVWWNGARQFQMIYQDITERKQNFERMRKALGATVQSISRTVEMKDPYTSGHQQRVSDLARSIATEMGLSADRRDFIRTASSIHDIGKISIPSEILSKPTKLTDLEFSLIKTHSQSGYDILKDIEFPWPVADVVLQHHERMDGSGYPQGLKGDDILLEARILAIADVVEAIASHRPYRPALGIDVALEEIRKNKGILYDNAVAMPV